MRVMHLLDGLGAGGTERMVVDLANAAGSAGIEASVCVTRSDLTLAGQLRGDVPVRALHRRSRFDLAGLLRLRDAVRDQGPDVLHVHGRSTFSLLATAAQLGLVRVPIVLHDHFGRIEMDASAPAWFSLWGRRRLGHYVGICAAHDRWAARAGIPEDRRSVIENALDLSRLLGTTSARSRAELGVPEGGLLGVALTNVRPEKGIDTLLEAFARLRTRPLPTLVVAGALQDRAYAGRCLALRDSLGLTGILRFLGARSDVPELLRAADFAVSASRSESGPLSLIEYMACGLPFAATRTGGVSELAAGGGMGEFVAPGDPTALAEAIDRLLSLGPEARRAKGRLGAEFALRHLEIKSRLPAWRRVYEAAARGAP